MSADANSKAVTEKRGFLKNSRARSAVLIAITLFIAVTALCLTFEFYPAGDYISKGKGVTLDDSWIHFVYARSFATTLRLDYNPGDAQSGFSSLLWIILLAPGIAVGLHPALWAKILGGASLFGCSFLASLLLLRRKGSAPIALAAGLAIAVQPLMPLAALSGMETVLSSFTIMLCVWALAEKKIALLAFSSAACVLARPDGAVTVGIIWVAALLSLLPKSGGLKDLPNRRMLPLVFIVPLLAGSIWAAYNYSAIERVLPMSYYLRAGRVPAVLTALEWRNLWANVSHMLQFHFPTGFIVFYFIGIAGVVSSRERLPDWPALVIPPLMAFLVGGETVFVVGGSFAGERYLTPVFPLIVLTAGYGAESLVHAVSTSAKPEGGFSLPLGIIASLAFLLVTLGTPDAYATRMKSTAEKFSTYCREIHDLQEATGLWIKQNTGTGDTVCTHDAGAVRYLGERRTIDIFGLNSFKFRAANGQMLHDECRYLVTFPEWSKAILKELNPMEIDRIEVPNNAISAGRVTVIYDLRRKADSVQITE